MVVQEYSVLYAVEGKIYRWTKGDQWSHLCGLKTKKKKNGLKDCWANQKVEVALSILVGLCALGGF